jgi:hypothetical protein
VSEQPVRFGPERTSLVALVIAVVCALPAAATWRPVAWFLLVLLAGAVWLLRARVVVGADGVEVCNGLGRRRVPWDAVEGFDVPPRGPVRLLHSGRRTVMTAVPHRDARRLVQAAERASSRAGAA